MKKLLYAVILIFLLIVSFQGGAWYHQRGAGDGGSEQGGRKILHYVDPMNPSHTSDKPGAAPCGMPMEPVYADAEAGGTGSCTGFLPPGVAKITPLKQQMIGIQVESVEKTAHGHVFRTLGKVAADENRTYSITAGDDGWVWRVVEGTTGSMVEKDQLMAAVYNYQFVTRQQQYLYALDFDDRKRKAAAQSQATPLSGTQSPGSPQTGTQQFGTQQSLQLSLPDSNLSMVPTTPGGGGMSSSGGLVYSVRDQLEIAKLELYNLGVGDYQIQEIGRTRQVTTDIQVRSPVQGIVVARNISPQQRVVKGAELFRVADVSTVWILADIFEGEAPFIRAGTKARLSLPGQAKTYDAKVTQVPPRFEQSTRSLKVRLEADNPGVELRPDMFVDVEFLVELPLAVSVPVDAVLDSGQKKTVFVDLGNGYFEPRTVETGWRHGDRVEIVQGIMPGERIVVSGNFLIDSESRMKLAAAGIQGTPGTDPTCGMPVYAGPSEAKGLFSDFDGHRYYFCCEECRKDFEKKHGKSPNQASEKGQNPGGQAAKKHEEMGSGTAADPVCGAIVDKSMAKAGGLSLEYGGRTYYFSSEDCMKQFDADPRKYAGTDETGNPPPGHSGHATREIPSPPVGQ